MGFPRAKRVGFIRERSERKSGAWSIDHRTHARFLFFSIAIVFRVVKVCLTVYNRHIEFSVTMATVLKNNAYELVSQVNRLNKSCHATLINLTESFLKSRNLLKIKHHKVL